MTLGLADAVVATDRVEAIRADLAVAAGSSHPQTAIVRLLEAENEVLRRAAAYLSQANLPGK